MRFDFVTPEGDERGGKLADVEIVFQSGEPLAGLRLVGCAVRRDRHGELYATFPARAYGVGRDRRYFDFLRATNADLAAVRALKQLIVDNYRAHAART